MRIHTIGVVSLMAAVALFVGTDAAQAKHGKKHCSSTHMKCCKKTHCCYTKGHNDAGSVISKRANCKTEFELLKKSGVCDSLCVKGPITVFCPTDAAYAKLGKARLDDIKSHPKKLANLLKYHIVKKKVEAGDIQAKGSLATVEGDSLMTNSNNGKAEVDGCIVVDSIPCSNGIVHLIDDVPVPERGR